MATRERHAVRPTVILGPSGKVPSAPDGLLGVARNLSSIPEQLRNGSNTRNTATNIPSNAEAPTGETSATPVLRASTDGPVARTNQAVESNSQTSVPKSGQSAKPTHPAADVKELEFLRKRDRLLNLNFQPSQKIALNEDMKFPEECKEHVRRLTRYLEDEPFRFEEAGYLTLVQCMGRRIGSKDDADNLVPYIRVTGLTTQSAVKAMHVLLSKSRVRSLYHPHIRICFDLSRVEASASDNVITVPGAPSNTLCGRLVVIKHNNIERTVTIGGLINVADRYYAMTTSHSVPSTSEEPSHIPNSVSDNDITIDANDYDDDVESALVIEGEADVSSPQNHSPAKIDFEGSETLGTLEESGPEWSLILIQNPGLYLPNFATNEDQLKAKSSSTPPERSYISSIAKTPSGTKVTVLAGASGQVQAKLSPNEAYTRLPTGAFVQTWTLSFESGNGLKKGDSGSWVVEPSSGVLYGHVIAISKGYAFIRPAKDIFREITKSLRCNEVKMPTPFDVLADLSKFFNNKLLGHPQAGEFARQAIAFDALRHSDQSPSAKALQTLQRSLIQSPSAKASPDSLSEQFSTFTPIISNILQATGSDVLKTLQEPWIWSSARSGLYGHKELTLSVLQSLSQEPSLTHTLPGIPDAEKNEKTDPSYESTTYRKTRQPSPIGITSVPTRLPYSRWSKRDSVSAPNLRHLPFTSGTSFLDPIDAFEGSVPTIATSALMDEQLHPRSASNGHLPPVFDSTEELSALLCHDRTELVKYFESELDVSKVDQLKKHLWLAGQHGSCQPLHVQKVLGREIIAVEICDLHLTWRDRRIFIKPCPNFLLNHETWKMYLNTDKKLYRNALGFLRTYASLVRRKSDLKIAHELGLLSPNLEWAQWAELSRAIVQARFEPFVRGEMEKYTDPNDRWCYGELRLERLDWIDWLCLCDKHTHRHYPGGVFNRYHENRPLLEQDATWMTVSAVCVALILIAMQVGMGTDRLSNNGAFTSAAVGFTIFSIIAPLAIVALIVAIVLSKFANNGFQTIHNMRARRTKTTLWPSP